MSTTATPAQIEALQRGESVELRIQIERLTSDWLLHMDYDILDDPPRILMRSHGGAYDETMSCPVAVGDTMDVVCSVCATEVAVRQAFGLIYDGMWANDDCPSCNGSPFISPTVHSIAHTETDGVHYWMIEVSP